MTNHLQNSQYQWHVNHALPQTHHSTCMACLLLYTGCQTSHIPCTYPNVTLSLLCTHTWHKQHVPTDAVHQPARARCLSAATPLPTQLEAVAVVMLVLQLAIRQQWLQLPSAAPTVCMPLGPLPDSCAAAVDSADTSAADAGARQLMPQGVCHAL